ncbi:hypothetical protein [Allokutzneria sp. NRRL B-24872]|uniref:hypothetical protein n=1 Tax=Allokutzneria sp. NRRL B-24872 TaxID=1137961 RepID=UPI000A3CB002|nr:hypothetical protein [Allokutzneria sp. NRRL B-24872]
MSGQRLGHRRLLAGVTAGALLTITASLALPAVAVASGEKLGQHTDAQPYKNNPEPKDWLGSYDWRGKQVWCVRFGLNVPDDGVEYTQANGPLTNKWGEPLGKDVPAKISYLLLRYQDTTSVHEAAALAHVLHVWTSGTTDAGRLDPSNTFDTVGYDEKFHFDRLTDEAKTSVGALREDADAHFGPWKVELTAPKDDQIIGKAGKWQLSVVSATGKPVGDVPVKLTATDGTLGGGEAARTPKDGKPLSIALTPTGEAPKLAGSVENPNADPVLLIPSNPKAQQIITTGGQSTAKAEAEAKARTAPGIVKLSKVDAATAKGVAGVALRVTAADKTSALEKQDGSKLVGADGKPAVLQTGQDGLVSIADLKTPQEACLIEVAPAPGYEEGFDPSAPPTVCGKLTPGATLALTLTNKPNTPKITVPKTIPAGDLGELALVSGTTTTSVNTAALAGIGVLGATAAALVLTVRRGRGARR